MRLDGLDRGGGRLANVNGGDSAGRINENEEVISAGGSVRNGDFSFKGAVGDGGRLGGGAHYYDYDDDDLSLMDDVEVRPIRRRDAVEAGLDYWIDEEDMERERERRIALRKRRRRRYATTSSSSPWSSTTTETGGGAMSTDRLREEVVAPYKQNWIGLVSIFFAAMSAILTEFPELLQIPVIPIPDL